jgi:hypothetical protein
MTRRTTSIIIAAAAAALPALAGAGPDCGRLPKGQNPPDDEIAKAIAASCSKHGVPTEIVKGVAYQESGIQQWRADGSFVHNVTDCGLGMMQLTGSTAKAFDIDKLKDDWRYNLDAGVKVLRDKWDYAQHQGKVTADPADRAVLENWFYAVAYYYGARNDKYVTMIYAHIAKRPGRVAKVLSHPVEITLPAKALPGFSFGKKFRAVKGDRWLDETGAEHKAPTHAATIGDEESIAKLEVLLARGKKALEAGKLGEAAKELEQVEKSDLDTDHKDRAKELLAKLDDAGSKKLDEAEALAREETPEKRSAAIALAKKIEKELPTRPCAARAKKLVELLESGALLPPAPDKPAEPAKPAEPSEPSSSGDE